MSVENLNEKMKQEELTRRKRYPLLDIVTNRTEIREICEEAVNYCAELYPETSALKEKNLWELMARISIELIKETMNHINTNKSKVGEVSFDLGEFLKIGIEYGETNNAEKEGTFNPIISVKSEMVYDNKVDINNKLPTDKPEFEDSAILNGICDNVLKTLETKYGVKLTHNKLVLYVFASFMRITKQYIIRNRFNSEYGVEINLADVIDISIEKYNGDDGDEYCIQIAPGQICKLQFAKNDGITESVGKEANTDDN